MGTGILGAAFRPIKGLYLSADAVGQAVGLRDPHEVLLCLRGVTAGHACACTPLAVCPQKACNACFQQLRIVQQALQLLALLMISCS